MMRRILGATAAAALVACSDPSAPPAFGTSSGSEPTTGGTTADVTGGTASSSTGAPPVPVVVLEGRFDLEVRDVIDIAVVQLGQDVVVTLDASESLGVLPTGPIEGVGRIDAYPEVGATVYTAIFGAPAIPGGPCGDMPVTLALSLHAVTGSDDVAPSPVVAGGITAYCGAEVTSGVPALEPLRIFGRRTI